MSKDGFFSKKGQRRISSFIAHELLYDYLTGQLDGERKKAFEEYLQDNKEAKGDIQKIQNGMSYAEKLSRVETSESLKERAHLPNSYSRVLLQKIHFEDWSPALRMGIEATIIALGISVLAILIPWHRLMDLRIGSKEVVLTEVEKGYTGNISSDSETSSKEEFTFPDEGAPSTTLKVADSKSPPPSSATTTTTTTTTTLAVAQVAATVDSVEKATENTAPAANEKRQGELYRGTIAVTNVEAVTPKLVEKVQELGGRKAGQVELGWNKNGDSSYFHFTMPDSRYDELMAVFSEYGKLKIQKEKHERVMPEGIRRLIITVDEKK